MTVSIATEYSKTIAVFVDESTEANDHVNKIGTFQSEEVVVMLNRILNDVPGLFNIPGDFLYVENE